MKKIIENFQIEKLSNWKKKTKLKNNKILRNTKNLIKMKQKIEKY